MDLKQQKIFEFDSGESEIKSFIHKPETAEKVRTSYGGGFRMLKKPFEKPENLFNQKSENSKVSNNQNPFKTLKEELVELKEKSAKIKTKVNQFKNSQKQDFFSNSYHIEENQFPNIKTLEELEAFKERGAKKLIELEAEYNRKMYEEKYLNNRTTMNEEKQPKSPKKKKKLKKSVDNEVFQQRFQQKFEKYLNEKKNRRSLNQNDKQQKNNPSHLDITNNKNERKHSADEKKILLK